MYESIVFDDLTLREIPVKLGGEDYVLREATGEAATIYRNCMLSATKLGENGRPENLGGYADAEPLLVSLCLFKKEGNGWGSVSVDRVKSWPAKVQKSLFEAAKEISDLDEVDDVDKLKKQRASIDKKIADFESKEDRLGKRQSSMTSGSE